MGILRGILTGVLMLSAGLAGREKGDRSNLCEAPSGPSRQIGPVPFFPATKKPPQSGAWQKLSGQLEHAAKAIPPGTSLTLSTAAKKPSVYRMPAEFERQETLLLVGDRLARRVPGVLSRVVEAIGEKMSIVCLVADDNDRSGVTECLPTAPRVEFLKVATDTYWIRDFGPLVVERTDGARVVIDPAYEKSKRSRDDAVPTTLARWMGAEVVDMPLALEGGDLLSNGRGLCVTTTAVVNRNIGRGYDARAVTELLHEYLGARQTVFLEPLRGDDTGHVDMFAMFVDADTIVVGHYPQSVDPFNSARLDRNAARLAEVSTPRGKLRVVRVPMPNNEDGVWRTYVNCIFANGTLLVPVYADFDPDGQAAAMKTLGRLLPDWKIVGIDVTRLIPKDGALRCISLSMK